MDSPVLISCAECSNFNTESLPAMVQHILTAHPESYNNEQALHYAQLWQEEAIEQQEVEDLERANYFRRHGVDPQGDWDDERPGK